VEQTQGAPERPRVGRVASGRPTGHRHTLVVLGRLARIERHLEAARQSVAAGGDCPAVLQTLAAARRAVDEAARLILTDHVYSCLVGAARDGQGDAALVALRQALERFKR
jgi:DNA-binding FrmR family transcriptional regulator